MLAPLAVAGFGFGLVAATLVDLILTGVPIRDAGSGSGVLSTTQQAGMALGMSWRIAVFALVTWPTALGWVTSGRHGARAGARRRRR